MDAAADTSALCPQCGAGTRCAGLEACTRCLPAVYGFTYRQLDWWTRRRYVRAADSSPGSGHPREWTAAELEIARRMAVLVRPEPGPGVAVSVAADFARNRWPDGEIAPGIWLSAFGDSEQRIPEAVR